MSFLWTVFWFVIAVGLLVTVHEFGHFWVARRLGFKVLRFSVGFGKPLLKRVAGPDQVEYVLATIPLGGYVKLLDEREAPVPPQELARSFTRRPVWQRILVLLAGPAFNVIFAVALLWGMLWVSGVTEVRATVGDVTVGSPAALAGLRPGDEVRTLNGRSVAGANDVIFGLLDAMSDNGEARVGVRGTDGAARTIDIRVPDAAQRRHLTEPSELLQGVGFGFFIPTPAVLGKVKPGGPAAQAGLMVGDTIVAVDGHRIDDFQLLANYIHAHPGEQISLDYRRGAALHSASVQVMREQANGKSFGRIQVEPAAPGKLPESILVHTALGPLAALNAAVNEAWDKTLMQARFFWRMVWGRVSLKNLNGPVAIAQFAGESAHMGVAAFLSLLVYLSLSLGFLNLLPIPILDGGQIVFQMVEWLKGSPLSERAQAFGQQVGIALLIVLMSVALYNDIARQFG
ncbi:MAG TPA: RIP metalloprotease RseP [Steroidobacteraceae bacterium]